jgi:hypothetical protein
MPIKIADCLHFAIAIAIAIVRWPTSAMHKTKSHYTKQNPTTQYKIPLHKTKFHYTKQNSTTQNKIHDTQNSIPQHKTQFRYTKQNSTTRNKIPLHKTRFTTHKTQFHYTKLYSTTQNRESAGKWHVQPVWPPLMFFLLRHLTVITMQRKIKFKAMESRFNK